MIIPHTLWMDHCAGEFGCIFAIFCGELNKTHIPSDEAIMEIYLVVAGIFSVLFPLFTWFDDENATSTVIWCCFCRFIVGICFAFISAASIKIAAEYVSSPNKITGIISVLHYSWPLSTAINIVAGYIITRASWSIVFVVTGIGLLSISVFAKVMFTYFPLLAVPTPVEEDIVINEEESTEFDNDFDAERENIIVEDQPSGLRAIFSDFNCLIIIAVSFFMTFRSRTIYIVTSSLWMEETFGLSGL